MSDTLTQNVTTETFTTSTGETVVHALVTQSLLAQDVGPPGPTGATGPMGPAGAPMLAIDFAWGDASPLVLTTVPAGQRIYTVQLAIETAFNGANPALSVGRAGAVGELLGMTENLPGTVGVYVTTPDIKYGSDTAINLYITPGAGASSGAGQVRLDIEVD